MPWLPVKEMAPVEQSMCTAMKKVFDSYGRAMMKPHVLPFSGTSEYTDMESVVNGYRQDALIGITGEKEFTDEQAGASAWLYAVRPLGRNSELGQARVIHVH